MAFDKQQTTSVNSLFPTVQDQASVYVSGEHMGSGLPWFPVPNVSPLDQHGTASYMLWSDNAQDDPYGLISNITSRNAAYCDEDTDLQGLVSNILEETDSQDIYYTQGNPSTCNSIWSPKTQSEELPQYFQCKANMQHTPFFQNSIPNEALSKTQAKSGDAEEFHPQTNGLTNNALWLVNPCPEDRDRLSMYPQKLPPGLPIPRLGNAPLSQLQYSNMSADKDRATSQPLNNYPPIRNFLRPENKINSTHFGYYYKNHCVQSNAQPVINEQPEPQDINQLVSNFQTFFMTGEHDGQEDFPNVQRDTVYHEDTVGEQWKITSPAAPMYTPKQLMGEFSPVQWERNGGTRKQTNKHDGCQDLPGFAKQSTDYVRDPKPVSSSLNLPCQHHNKTNLHRESPLGASMNRHSTHIQQGQIHSKSKQMQRDKERMQMSRFVGERPFTTGRMKEGDKPASSPNAYFDVMGNMQRFGENNLVSSGTVQQFVPANDPRHYSSLPVNHSNVTSRQKLPHGCAPPWMNPSDMMSAYQLAALNFYLGDTMTHRGDGACHGLASAAAASAMMHQMMLLVFLDECSEQWKCLEEERKKTENILSQTFPGKWTAAVTNVTFPKMPPNPTRVDHLVVHQLREEARVVSLLDRMESLSSIPLDTNIHMALNRHHIAISHVQAKRKDELASMSKPQQQRAHGTDDIATLMLLIAIKELAGTTRRLRTALWCALNMTVPKPVKKEEQVDRKEEQRDSSPSPFEGYSFTL